MVVDHRSFKFPEPRERERAIPDVLRDPLRAAVFIAAVATAIGTFLPWLHAVQPGYAPYDISGFEEAGDGGIVLEMVLLAAAIAWSERAWHSAYPLVVAGPLILGIINLLVLRLAWVNFETLLRFLERAGGHATYQAGFWLTLGSTVALVICGLLVVWRARRRVSFRVGVASATVATIGGGIIGSILGFVAGSQIAALFTREAIAGVATTLIVILAFTLAIVGAWVGALIGAGAARALRR